MKILVVEDEPILLEFLAGALTGCAHDVRASVTAAAALDVLRDWQPDLLLCDLDLAEGKAEDLAWVIARLRLLDHPVCIILISARPERLARSCRAADGLMLKPVGGDELLTMIALAG